MWGLIIILAGLLLLIGKEKRSPDLIVDFKEFTMAIRLLMIIVFFGSIYLLVTSQWKDAFLSTKAFFDFLDTNVIVVCCLVISGIILIENLIHRPIAYISNPKIRVIVYTFFAIIYVGIGIIYFLLP